MAVETSVIIVNYRADVYVKRLQNTLRDLPNSEVIVIDHSDGRRGYGAGCNQGARQARGKYLVCLNADVMIKPADIDRLVKVLQDQPAIGLVGPQIRNASGEVQISCSAIPTPFLALIEYSWLRNVPGLRHFSQAYRLNGFDHRTSRVVPAIGGSCLVMRRRDWQAIDGFDEKLFLYFEEFDLAKRLHDQLNLATYFCAEAVLTHFGQVSTKQTAQARQHFQRSRHYWLGKAYGWRGRLTAFLLKLMEKYHG